MSAEPLWQLTDVRFFGPPTDWPRKPFTVTIPPGRTALLGPSGAGKTSLIEVLVGLTNPHGGNVRSPSHIAWVPQDHGLWHAHSVREHLTLVGASIGECDALLSAFDLTGVGEFRADAISLGEAARLSVARALAQKAPVIVMDEPLAHVDTARAGKYWRTIREHVARSGASLVLATHAPEIALAEAQHAICLQGGECVFTGELTQLYDHPASEELASFLGPTNWITPPDARTWLDETWTEARSVRPERMMIFPSQNCDTTVIASRFFGTYAETDVRESDGTGRTFIHRPPASLAPGERICIALVAQ